MQRNTWHKMQDVYAYAYIPCRQAFLNYFVVEVSAGKQCLVVL